MSLSISRESTLGLAAAGVGLSALFVSRFRHLQMQQKLREDPHRWLEDVLGDRPLAWVEGKNKECIKAVGDVTKTGDTYGRILSILDSKDKIPPIYRIGTEEDGGMFYNFWRDDTHVQGIWRKTTLESYRGDGPTEWKTVLDFDKLPPPTVGTAKTWVWHGSTLLDPGPLPGAGKADRALISMSPGGSDADTKREFDLVAEDWVPTPSEGGDGFHLPVPAKTRASYRSRDELLVGTDFGGDGSALTDSGYPRVIKSWKRGTPIEDAKVVFEGEQADVAAAMYAYHDRGEVHEIQVRAITFYTSKHFYRSLTAEDLAGKTAAEDETPFKEVPIQEDAEFGTFGAMALITLRSDWTPDPGGGSTTFKSGSLLSVPIEDVMNNEWSRAQALFEPTASTSLQSTTETRDYLVLKVSDHVRTRLVFWRYAPGKPFGTWTEQKAGGGGGGGLVPAGEDVGVSSINRNSELDNKLWLWRDGYLVPNTLELSDAESGCARTEKITAEPARFDSSGLVVEQDFVESKDGTRIPFFVMRPKDLAFDGTAPTLLDAYGGFEIPMLPGYSGSVGAGWLERGGVKVIANIRGGGEYGPMWHQAALQEKRHKAYEDVEAVAQALIDKKITSPPHLACIGGSNGGLLVGNMITRPVSSRLFGAAVCQVPLLDMKVYNTLLAGASWMAEYGNPDKPEEWAFLRHHSAYQLLRHDCLGRPEESTRLPEPTPEGGKPGDVRNDPEGFKGWTCPKLLMMTSTRDDRVHPGHARKMVRSLEVEASAEQAPEVLYYENTEGGHGGAADNKQRAHMWALTYTFLAQRLGLGEGGGGGGGGESKL